MHIWNYIKNNISIIVLYLSRSHVKISPITMTDHHHCQHRTCLYFTVSVCAISKVFTWAKPSLAVPTTKNLPYNEVSKYANLFRLGSCSVQNFTLVPFEASTIFDISQDRQDRPGLSLSFLLSVLPSDPSQGCWQVQHCGSTDWLEQSSFHWGHHSYSQLQPTTIMIASNLPVATSQLARWWWWGAGQAVLGMSIFSGSKVVVGDCRICSSFIQLNVGLGRLRHLTPTPWSEPSINYENRTFLYEISWESVHRGSNQKQNKTV